MLLCRLNQEKVNKSRQDSPFVGEHCESSMATAVDLTGFKSNLGNIIKGWGWCEILCIVVNSYFRAFL